MSNYIDYESLELSVEQSAPFTNICYQLIEESKGNLRDLIALSGLEEDNLIHFLKLIGGGFLAKKIMDTSDDEELVKRLERSIYTEDPYKIFENFKEVSKVNLTLDQAYCLGIGVVLIEESFAEIDYLAINWTNWNNIDQFTNLEEIMRILNQVNYFIGQGMGSFYQARDMDLNKSKGIHTLGGEVRAKAYDKKRREAIRLYEQGKYHTYIGCGRKICDQLGVVPETIAKWLSEHYKIYSS